VRAKETTFPLLSRRRAQGTSVGLHRSAQRGSGYEIVSTRSYQRGDNMRAIDWNASARLSTAKGSDEFVVRDHFAEESPRVVVLVDRRPEMALYPDELPWLHKQRAVEVAGRMIVDSALAARGVAGYLDLSGGSARWMPPTIHSAHRIRDRALAPQRCDAPANGVAVGLSLLLHSRRELPTGTFVFVLSDFLVPPPRSLWRSALTLGWDVVPVIIQDPRWEQSFPGRAMALPLVDAEGGALGLVRIGRREALERREAHEARLAALLDGFATLDIDPVVLGSEARADVHAAFLRWHARRRKLLRRLAR
jgi:uncharacterized protein (DUF58 family)